MTPLRYKAIIFDLDGTLIDSSASILDCFRRVLHENGLDPQVPLHDSIIGPPLRQTLKSLSGIDNVALLDRLEAGFKAYYDTEGYKATRVYPEVAEMLVQLGETGIPLAIATNKRRVPTLKIIDHFEWGRFFHAIGTLDMCTPPHGSKSVLIRFLLDKMNLDPSETLYVGDKIEDGEAARNNGMPFAAAVWGYGDWANYPVSDEWLLLGTPQQVGR